MRNQEQEEVKPLFFTEEDLSERIGQMSEMFIERERFEALDSCLQTENNQPATHFSF
ncbi:hypothetical protein HYT26_00935 [Candidatus Pacearchaeota archaeon]|nr:hypothetical protein [Candidatus Pacearchaeota archaeon]